MPINEIAEHRVLRDLKDGRRNKAISRLMDLYGVELYRYCYSYIGNKEDAEDMLQRTYMQAFEGLGRFSQKSAIRTWLYSIARNRCLDKLKADRRLSARIEFVDEPPEHSADNDENAESVESHQLREALRVCLQGLSGSIRSTVLLRFQSGLSYSEMAVVVHEKAKTLQTRVARALPTLRDCLRERGISL